MAKRSKKKKSEVKRNWFLWLVLIANLIAIPVYVFFYFKEPGFNFVYATVIAAVFVYGVLQRPKWAYYFGLAFFTISFITSVIQIVGGISNIGGVIGAIIGFFLYKAQKDYFSR